MKTRKKINNFLKKLIYKGKTPKNYGSIDIFKFKKLDSVSVFKLLLKIESKFMIKISDNELFSNKFRKFSNLVKLIEKKTYETKKK